MLITRRSGELVLVTHPDHGVLAGALAEQWGNDRFAAPARRASFADAAAHHDDGWAELDGRPVYAPDAQRPAHFLEIDLPDTVGPYGRGVDSVHDRDPYAGALVSMHWAGLYSTRWGLQPGPPVGHPAAAAVVAEQERRWVAALRAAWDGDGPRSALEADAWHGYEVLQALDLLSLFLCLTDLDAPTDAAVPALALHTVLALVDQPPGARIAPAAPGAPRGEHVDLTLTVSEPGVVLVDPFPFAASGVEIAVPARRMEDQPYPSAEVAAAAFAAAPVAPIHATLVSRPA